MATIIYAADDDENIRNLMQAFLVNEGYTIKMFDTGDALYEEFLKKSCDLIILDVMMPGTDGLTICNKIRKKSKVPIIMLTAKDTDSDYITGITLGCDDYLTKPFRPTMLTVRVKALLRRIAMEREGIGVEQSEQDKDYSFGDLYYFHKKHCVTCRGINLGFTETELKFFLFLLTHKNEAVSKNDLLDKIWGHTFEIETRVTDETARRIRKKIKLVNSNVLVRTVWGYGYRLDILEEPACGMQWE